MERPRLKKSLGQHHLRQAGVTRPLMDFLRPAGARVMEIGPGGGVLTRVLLAAGARVVGVELDLSWAAAVARQLAGEALSVVVADAVELAYDRLPPPTLVAGNLPYNVATRIILAVLPHHPRVPRAGFLVQREVAERLAASPGSRPYGSLSVLVQSRAEVEILGRVRPGSFHPPPRVESAFVGLRLRRPPLPEGAMEAFQELVRQAFAHKRKTLRNALSYFHPRSRVEELLERAGLDARVRAEELGLDRWLELFTALEAPEDGPPGGRHWRKRR